MTKNILITAGATKEYIDPVRYITNGSSGVQGLMLSKAILNKGISVILIKGDNVPQPEPHPNLRVINVVSADDMYETSMKYFPYCDGAICAAAVGDYKVKDISRDKIKRTGDSIMIELVPNKDIAKSLGEIKKENQLLIGFALETSNGLNNAITKIHKKNLDYCILNEITLDNPAFNVNYNTVSIIDKNGEVIDEIKNMDKEDIAYKIIDKCLREKHGFYTL